MSVRRAKMEISSAEFTDWMAYCEIAPFGAEVEDRRHGDVMSTLTNAHFGNKERTWSADEFMFGDTGQSATDDEPVLLDDAVAQSNLIRAAMFGLPPKETVA